MSRTDVIAVLWGSCAMLVAADVLFLKWCDVYIIPFLGVASNFYSLLLCGVQFCCMLRVFFSFFFFFFPGTSRNVDIGVCVVACVLLGSVGI
jgi:hypothetical protein